MSQEFEFLCGYIDLSWPSRWPHFVWGTFIDDFFFTSIPLTVTIVCAGHPFSKSRVKVGTTDPKIRDKRGWSSIYFIEHINRIWKFSFFYVNLVQGSKSRTGLTPEFPDPIFESSPYINYGDWVFCDRFGYLPESNYKRIFRFFVIILWKCSNFVQSRMLIEGFCSTLIPPLFSDKRGSRWDQKCNCWHGVTKHCHRY